MQQNTNKYLSWQIGASAQRKHTITSGDVSVFVDLIGDVNPVHKGTQSAAIIVPGAMLIGLATGLVGSQLPGSGCILISQEAAYLLPVYAGDTVQMSAEIIAKDDQKQHLFISTCCTSEQRELLMTGKIVVMLRKR